MVPKSASADQFLSVKKGKKKVRLFSCQKKKKKKNYCGAGVFELEMNRTKAFLNVNGVWLLRQHDFLSVPPSVPPHLLLCENIKKKKKIIVKLH